MTSVPAIVVPAATRHTATLIFLHGLGDTGYGWSSIAENFRLRRKFDEAAMIFPHARPMPITCNMGMVMPGWYDIKDFGNLPNAEEDQAGMLQSVSTINKIIGEQVDKGISPERIIVGGFSQGGVIALMTGLCSERRLGGIIALSSYLPLCDRIATMLTEKGKKVPIFMGHGKRDQVVRYEWGMESKELLDQMGLEVTWRAYDDLQHSATPAEISDVEQWMEQRLKETQ